MNYLIRKAKIVDKGGKHNGKTLDVLVVGNQIKKIGKDLKPKEKCTEISFKDLHLSTGWFDMNANFGDPGFEYKEDFETGLKAAANGGFTGVAAMPSNEPVTDNKGAVEYIVNRTKNSVVDVFPIGCVSKGMQGKELSEMFDMAQSGAIAFSDDKSSILNSALLQRALLYTKGFNSLVINYPNNENIAGKGMVNEGVNSTSLGLKGIPALAEEIMVTRDIFLAEYCESPVHLTTISTKGSVEIIKNAQKKKIKVTGDVSSVNLFFTDDMLKEFDSNFKVKPPLREKVDINMLIKGLKDGTIAAICSNHNPKDIEEKKCEFDNAAYGAINLQTCFAAANSVLQKHLNLEDIITKLTSAPREILKLESLNVEEGATANLTLFNPKLKWKLEEKMILSKSKNSPFIGKVLTGKALGIINKGKFVEAK